MLLVVCSQNCFLTTKSNFTFIVFMNQASFNKISVSCICFICQFLHWTQTGETIVIQKIYLAHIFILQCFCTLNDSFIKCYYKIINISDGCKFQENYLTIYGLITITGATMGIKKKNELFLPYKSKAEATTRKYCSYANFINR